MGFGIVKPSPASIELFTKVADLRINNTANDQIAINQVLKEMQLQNKIRAKALNIKLFPAAQIYYLDGKREFLGDNPCTECVIVHGFGVKTKAAKIYRFREEALWKADEETYFSNPNEKYLIYENIKNYIGKKTINEEDMALKTAFKIGFLLNRIVILPKLNCKENFKCTILHRYRIEDLTILSNCITENMCSCRINLFLSRLKATYLQRFIWHHKIQTTQTREKIHKCLRAPVSDLDLLIRFKL